MSLAGTGKTSTTSSIVFTNLANGSYSYLVQSEGPFRASIAPEGSVLVAGADALQPLGFVRGPTDLLTFREVGLRPGTSWCVTVGASVCSTNSLLRFKHLTPGMYQVLYPYVRGTDDVR